MSKYNTRGQHWGLDVWGVEADLLNDAESLIALMYGATQIAGATVLKHQEHRFHPQGVTALLLLSESHLSVHTYPEKGFAAFDVYTCGDHVTPLEAVRHLVYHLEPEHTQRYFLVRGVRSDE